MTGGHTTTDIRVAVERVEGLCSDLNAPDAINTARQAMRDLADLFAPAPTAPAEVSHGR